ncbi:Uncharacterised protein [Mycobacteroides abscessus subsp. abscessus]|nr:Uncharacterised protein [Mycobacteroides abscessus subsp. abscessus]
MAGSAGGGWAMVRHRSVYQGSGVLDWVGPDGRGGASMPGTCTM